MKTYFYTETDSPERGMNVRITVWRIKQNRPHIVGHSDSQTASWPGGHGEAQRIIHIHDKIPMIRQRHDWAGYHQNRMTLKNLYGFADLYTVTSGPGIRLFSV